jgi:anthranilate phosphoribosyltransferase
LKYLQKIVDGHDLTLEESESLMGEVFNGASDAEIGAMLIALRMKGETPGELAGFARSMRAASVRISPAVRGTIVDTCGTGGDGSNTINISTAAAIVAASAGVFVAKHGNYAVSSKCGSANVLSELGVKVSATPEDITSCIEAIKIGFMLAPLFHPAMKRVAQVRSSLGLRTVFNILGPLTNPAGAKAQLMGVYSPNLCLKMASVLRLLGSDRAMIVHGEGMDEITNTGNTNVVELKDGVITSYILTPEALGYEKASKEEIAGGSPKQNAMELVSIFKGRRCPGRDVIAMNAGAVIYLAGLAKSIEEGCMIAEESISSGRSMDTLKAMVNHGGNPAMLERFL